MQVDWQVQFLKEQLIVVLEEDWDTDADTIEMIKEEKARNNFADLAAMAGLPKKRKGVSDTLDLLAKMELPIYITTSPFDFLERAIERNGRQPRTQVCFWSDEPLHVDESHRTDYNFVPSKKNPVVYHIFGLENYPESMVLTENDHLDFLVSVSRARSIIPPLIKKEMTDSSLVLLGYELPEWDFRVLFRGLIAKRQRSRGMLSLAIQLERTTDEFGHEMDLAKAKDYLETYFDSARFEIYWGDSARFVKELWDHWGDLS